MDQANHPNDKSHASQPVFVEPKEGEDKEEFTKRVIKLFRERGLITGKKPQPPRNEQS
jgi:hypothetical protein